MTPVPRARTLLDMNSLPALLGRYGLLLALLLPAALFGQGYEADDNFPGPVRTGPERRSVGLMTRLFNSPAKTNAAEQLAYAKELEAAGKTRPALKAYKAAYLFFQTAPEAPEALLRYARLLEKRGKYAESFNEYQYLIERYGGRFPYESVIESQYALANQIRTQRYGRWFFGVGFVTPERAIPLYFQVATNAPSWTNTPQALLRAAAIYREQNYLEEAIATYADIQTRYPDAEEAGEAAYQMVETMMATARQQRNNNQQAAATRAALAQYLKDHPDTPHREEAEASLEELDARLAQALLDRARVYEKARKNKIAASLYRQMAAQFPRNPQAAQALEKALELDPEAPPQEPSRP